MDGFGGIHELGGAPPLTREGRPYFNIDIARDFEVYGNGYILLDGYGWVYAVGDAISRLPIDATGDEIPSPYFGFDIARDIEFVPDLMGNSGYYVMDGYGALHPRGDAAIPQPNAYFNFDISRDIELLFFADYGYTNYQLDGWGGMHPTVDRINEVSDPRQLVRFSFYHYTLGWDVAVDFEVVKTAGTPVLLPTRTPKPTPTPDETSFVPTFTPTETSTSTPTLTPTSTPSETSFIPEISLLIDREVIRDWSNQVLKR
jgi:hypothetical protein